MLKIKTYAKVEVDNRMWEKMKGNLLKGGDKTVQVGWWADYHPSGPPTAQIAAWNEEGHVNMGMFAGTITPARPFIRKGFVPESKKIIPKFYKDIHLIAIGKKSWTSFYREFGTKLLKIMQETIHKWDTPPNSPATVGLKGFNNPLIETGYMQSSVKYRIVSKGGK